MVIVESDAPAEEVTQETTAPEGQQSETQESPNLAGTPPEGEQPKEPKEPEQVDWKAKSKEDAALRDFVQKEANRLAQRAISKKEKEQQRQEAKQAEDDPDRALEYVKKYGQRTDAEEDSDTEDITPQQRIERNIQAFNDRGDTGMNWLLAEPEYGFLWAHHKAELDKQLGELSGPEFARWVIAEGREREIDYRADQKARQQAKPLAEAMAHDQTNKALQNVPQALNGNAGGGQLSDDAFIQKYAAGDSDDHQRYQEIQRRRE